MKPCPLQPGDSIAVLAPSSPFDPEGFERASHALESLGYRLVPGVHAFKRNGYLAGSDLERVEDLVRALRNPSIAAVVCIRGGFGSSRLLDWLPFSTFTGRPKILLGYSDITFLHAAFFKRLNWVTFHGPNLIEAPSDATQRTESLFHVLEGKKPVRWDLEPHQILLNGRAQGRIVGGNLTCFAHLIGTPYFPETSGALLFLEDRGEALYRIDRTFVQLKQAGVLRRITGLILGSFLDCGPSDAVWNVVLEHTHTFTFPVICAMPFGHGSANEILPLGLPFSLDTRKGTLEASESPFEVPPQKDARSCAKARSPVKAPVETASPPASGNGCPALVKLFEEALETRVFSGAVLLVAHADQVLLCSAWGTSCHGGAPIDTETLFDLASLTKPLAVVPLLMQAVSTGALKLEDPLTRFFPAAFLGAAHRTITIRQLLNHCSGFAPYEPFFLQLIQKPPEVRKGWLLESVLKSPLISNPGTACHYSDLGFMVLANVLETVLERPLHDLAEEFFTRDRVSLLESPAPMVEHGSNDFTGSGTPPLPTRPAPPGSVTCPCGFPGIPSLTLSALRPRSVLLPRPSNAPGAVGCLKGRSMTRMLTA